MKKILVLGNRGMAGHCIYSYLKSLNKYKMCVEYSSRIGEPEWERMYENSISIIEPDIIINCIGILVKASENNPTEAILVNSYFPHWLEKITENTQTKIIHLSTDCVFSGQNKVQRLAGNYLDTDTPDGVGFYARSKAFGEIINNKDLTLRMSIIGKELKKGGTGLFEWFMGQKGVVLGYSEAYWNGITTLELAKAIDKLIESDIVGLYHLAPNYKISKYNLLRLIQEIFEKYDISVQMNSNLKQDKTLINSEPPIPNYIMPSSYEQMLKEYKDYLDANESN